MAGLEDLMPQPVAPPQYAEFFLKGAEIGNKMAARIDENNRAKESALQRQEQIKMAKEKMFFDAIDIASNGKEPAPKRRGYNKIAQKYNDELGLGFNVDTISMISSDEEFAKGNSQISKDIADLNTNEEARNRFLETRRKIFGEDPISASKSLMDAITPIKAAEATLPKPATQINRVLDEHTSAKKEYIANQTSTNQPIELLEDPYLAGALQDSDIPLVQSQTKYYQNKTILSRSNNEGIKTLNKEVGDLTTRAFNKDVMVPVNKNTYSEITNFQLNPLSYDTQEKQNKVRKEAANLKIQIEKKEQLVANQNSIARNNKDFAAQKESYRKIIMPFSEEVAKFSSQVDSAIAGFSSNNDTYMKVSQDIMADPSRLLTGDQSRAVNKFSIMRQEKVGGILNRVMDHMRSFWSGNKTPETKAKLISSLVELKKTGMAAYRDRITTFSDKADKFPDITPDSIKLLRQGKTPAYTPAASSNKGKNKPFQQIPDSVLIDISKKKKMNTLTVIEQEKIIEKIEKDPLIGRKLTQREINILRRGQ